jgi:hypothetical protein
MENLNGLRGERSGNVVRWFGVKVGSISRLEERDSRLLASLSLPTFEEPENMPTCMLGGEIDFMEVGRSSTPTCPERLLVPLPLPRSQV